MRRAAVRAQKTAPFASTLDVLASAESHVYTAAVLHVRVDGAVACESAFGAIVPGGARTQVETLFDVASITKVLAGTALLALFDERAIALDDPIVSVLPEFAGKDARRAAVTFRSLLTHTSGLPAHVSFRDEVGARAILERVCSTPLASSPGSSVTYSDLGFMLVGAAVEKIGDAPLQSVVSEYVFEPLGLAHASYVPSYEQRGHIACTERDSWRGRLLQGEVHDENCWSMGGVSGHAGIFATAREIAELGEAYIGGGAARSGERILSRHAALLATRECARSDDERRGLSWALRTSARQSCGSHFGPDSFGHTGYTGTSLWVDPARSLTVVLLTNRVYFTRDPTPIFELRAAVHDAVIEDLEAGSTS